MKTQQVRPADLRLHVPNPVAVLWNFHDAWASYTSSDDADGHGVCDACFENVQCDACCICHRWFHEACIALTEIDLHDAFKTNTLRTCPDLIEQASLCRPLHDIRGHAGRLCCLCCGLLDMHLKCG